MVTPPLVQINYWYSYPKRHPGEVGLVSTVCLRFLDQGGRVARLVRLIDDARLAKELVFENLRASKGFVRLYWSLRHKSLDKQEARLLEKARLHAKAALTKSARGIGWEIASTTSEGFYPLEQSGKRTFLLHELGSVTQIMFSVVNSTPSPLVVA